MWPFTIHHILQAFTIDHASHQSLALPLAVARQQEPPTLGLEFRLSSFRRSREQALWRYREFLALYTPLTYTSFPYTPSTMNHLTPGVRALTLRSHIY